MFKTYQIIRSNKSWCFVFLVCIFSSRKRQLMSSSDVIHYMMFWHVPNKMEQRTELIGFYVCVFMRIETILSNFMRNWQFYSELGIADCNVTQLWCQRTVDTWKNLLLADNASTHKAWSLCANQMSKMSMFSPKHPTVQTMACTTLFFKWESRNW